MARETDSGWIAESGFGECEEDESVVSLDPIVRQAIERTAPTPSAKWRLYLYRDYFFIRHTQ